MRKKSAIIFAILAFFLISTSYSWSFEVSKTSKGATIKWKNPNAAYYINTSGTSPVLPNEAINALRLAMDEWTNVPTSSFEFFYYGTTANSYGRNNMNTVSFRNMGSSSTLAVNGFWFYVDTGEMVESDIEFNTYHSYGVNGNAGVFDIQNIAAHEFGHSLSLKDLYSSADSEKTMYGYASSGETKKRNLHQDDIDGISFLYPVSVPVCTYSISPSTATFSVLGGSGSVMVTTSAGCNWTISNNIPWITIDSGSSGSQSGTVSYTVSQNTDANQRSGSITIAGKTFTVIQEGINPNQPTGITVDPSSLDFGSVILRASVVKTFTITNTSSGNLKISAAMTGSNVSDFRVRLSARTLGAGASATATVTFRPRSIGQKNASIVISTNNQSIQWQNVTLIGKGVTY